VDGTYCALCLTYESISHVTYRTHSYWRQNTLYEQAIGADRTCCALCLPYYMSHTEHILVDDRTHSMNRRIELVVHCVCHIACHILIAFLHMLQQILWTDDWADRTYSMNRWSGRENIFYEQMNGQIELCCALFLTYEWSCHILNTFSLLIEHILWTSDRADRRYCARCLTHQWGLSYVEHILFDDTHIENILMDDRTHSINRRSGR